MKIFLSILLVFSIHIFSDDHKKLDPIIFMLDLSVNDGKIKKAEKFTYDITKNVMKMEPDTVIYQYYLTQKKKSSYMKFIKVMKLPLSTSKIFVVANGKVNLESYFLSKILLF